MTKHTVLFELGCEELPPKSLKTLRDALKAETEKGLKDAGLNFAAIEAYAAPRRLALKLLISMLLKQTHKNVLTALLYKRLMMLKANQLKHLKALCVVKALRLISFQLSKQVKLKKFAS
jgi:hypothetical protein